MAQILQQPAPLSLSRNLNVLKISSSSLISFRLLKGTDILLDEYYSPDAYGNIEIELSEIVTSSLSVSLPTYSEEAVAQSDLWAVFNIEVDGERLGYFRAVRAGVDHFSGDAATFLNANFLTWQPQTKEVTYDQPEWLTFFTPGENRYLKVRYYKTDGSTIEKTLFEVTNGTCAWSVNVTFARLWNLTSGERYGYVDVWLEDDEGVKLSYTQRYICRQKEALDNIYLAENSLGGIDTFTLSGALIHIPDITRENIQVGNTLSTGLVNIANTYSQNTGMLYHRESKWVLDLLNSEKAFILSEGSIRTIVIDTSSISASNIESMHAFEFTYRISDGRGLLNVSRFDTLPDNLEIPGPDNTLFFLAPRLVDFPVADLTSELLLLAQSPFLQEWKYISLSSLKATWHIDSLIEQSHTHSNLDVLEHILDNLPVATLDDLGGIKLGYASSPSKRAVLLDIENRAYVDIPTEEYPSVQTLSVYGSIEFIEGDNYLSISSGIDNYGYKYLLFNTGNTAYDYARFSNIVKAAGYKSIRNSKEYDVLDSGNYSDTIGHATAKKLGLIKGGYSDLLNTNNIPLQIDDEGRGYVTIPNISNANNNVSQTLLTDGDDKYYPLLFSTYSPAFSGNRGSYISDNIAFNPNSNTLNVGSFLLLGSQEDESRQCFINYSSLSTSREGYTIAAGSLDDGTMLDIVTGIPIADSEEETYPAVYARTRDSRYSNVNLGRPENYWGTLYTENISTDYINLLNRGEDNAFVNLRLEDDIFVFEAGSYISSFIFEKTILPTGNDPIDLGSSNYRWNHVFANCFFGEFSGTLTDVEIGTAVFETLRGDVIGFIDETTSEGFVIGQMSVDNNNAVDGSEGFGLKAIGTSVIYVDGYLVPHSFSGEDKISYLGSLSNRWDFVCADTVVANTVTGNIKPSGNVIPLTDNAYDIGSSDYRWAAIHGYNIYANTLQIDVPTGDSPNNRVSLSGDMEGGSWINNCNINTGQITFRDTLITGTSRYLSIGRIYRDTHGNELPDSSYYGWGLVASSFNDYNIDIFGHLLPYYNHTDDDVAFNLGSSEKRWLNIYAENIDLNGTLSTQSLTIKNSIHFLSGENDEYNSSIYMGSGVFRVDCMGANNLIVSEDGVSIDGDLIGRFWNIEPSGYAEFDTVVATYLSGKLDWSYIQNSPIGDINTLLDTINGETI